MKMTIKDEIIKIIEILLNKEIKKIKADKTYPSVITSVLDGKYVVTLNGSNYTVKCAIPNVELKSGQQVWVTVPCGDLKEMFIFGLR